MNPMVPSTVTGDLATVWGRFAAVTIDQTVVAVTHLRILTNPRLHPTRCRLFRRILVLVARDRIKENRLLAQTGLSPRRLAIRQVHRKELRSPRNFRASIICR